MQHKEKGLYTKCWVSQYVSAPAWQTENKDGTLIVAVQVPPNEDTRS
jgi:CO/xanthine dehydrogenase FAD-binding subunit